MSEKRSKGEGPKSQREIIDAELEKRGGKEAVTDIEADVVGIENALKALVAEKKDSDEIDAALRMLREFSNNLFARLFSQNARDPKRVETAIRLANALLSVEPTDNGKEAAKDGLAILQKRYGLGLIKYN